MSGSDLPPSFTPGPGRRRPAPERSQTPAESTVPRSDSPEQTAPPSFTPPERRRSTPTPEPASAPSAPEPTLLGEPAPAGNAPQRRSILRDSSGVSSRESTPPLPAATPPAYAPRRTGGADKPTSGASASASWPRVQPRVDDRRAAPPAGGRWGSGRAESSGPRQPTLTAPTPKRRRRKGWKAVLAVVVVLVIAWPTWLLWHTNASMHHVEATSTSADTRGITYLFAGSDSRDGWNPDDPTEGQRSDSTILVHRAPNGQSSMVSLPRDSYVAIPGYGMNKLNAAFAFGGPTLLIATVEQATGLHVDHYVEIGMQGVTDIVDALGGIELCWDADVDDAFSGMIWEAGCHEVDGVAALAFSRMRYSDPTGDIGRQMRQRQVLNAVVSQTLRPAVLLNPIKQYQVSTAAGEALTVGNHTNIFNVARLLLTMRKATSSELVGTPPLESVTAMNEVGSVVLWDDSAAAAFFERMNAGTLRQSDFIPLQ